MQTLVYSISKKENRTQQLIYNRFYLALSSNFIISIFLKKIVFVFPFNLNFYRVNIKCKFIALFYFVGYFYFVEYLPTTQQQKHFFFFVLFIFSTLLFVRLVFRNI